MEREGRDIMDDETRRCQKRRSVLRAIGAGGVGSVGLAGAVSGRSDGKGGPNGKGKPGSKSSSRTRHNGCPCPDGQTLLAKYEVQDGEFVFEKGRETLGVDGDQFTFSEVVTKNGEDDEIVGFDWDSGSLCVTSVTVKYGPETETVDVCEDATDECDVIQNEGCAGSTCGSVAVEEYAVSYVAFCTRVLWQLDLVTGSVESPPEYACERTLGTVGNVPVTGDVPLEEGVGYFNDPLEDSQCYESDTPDIGFSEPELRVEDYSTAGGGTACASFDIAADADPQTSIEGVTEESVTVTFAVYETPTCSISPIESQVLVDYVTRTYEFGTSSNEMCVRLPTPTEGCGRPE
jgi:hypothetical protein